MRYKIVALAALAVIIYSCAAKSSAPTADVKTMPETKVSKSTTSLVLTAELAEGKSLFENNCAKCHRLYEPKEFSSEEWKPIVSRMQKKAHLDDVAGQKIFNYVTMK